MKNLVAVCLLALTLPATAFEIRVHPGNPVYVYDLDARRGLATAMIQNLAVYQPAGAPVTLTGLSIELRAGEVVRQTTSYAQADLAKAAARMSALDKAGALALYDFAFQRSRYLGRETRLAASETVEAGSALVMTAIPLLVPRGVDSMRITAHATGADGKPVETSLDVPLARYEQKNDYSFPIRGASTIVVGPGLSEPHRWALNEEFALDVVRLGASGTTCKDDCSELSDYYGWGAGVLAVADGEVVAVEASQKESSARLRQPGESGDAFMQRTMADQEQLLSKGAAGVGGNFVVIRHEGGEYSHYAHLAEGSVSLKAGDIVKRGQPIGKLGHSGNSTEPHLHFGIADGADPLYSRSLPVKFSGLTTVDGPQPPSYVQSGWIVKN